MEWLTERALIREIPRSAIIECSGPGDVTEAVAYWTARLGLDADPDLAREVLASTGGWERDALADHDENRERLLWVICCAIYEDPETPIYLGE